jgi:hypothetical protein
MAGTLIVVCVDGGWLDRLQSDYMILSDHQDNLALIFILYPLCNWTFMQIFFEKCLNLSDSIKEEYFVLPKWERNKFQYLFILCFSYRNTISCSLVEGLSILFFHLLFSSKVAAYYNDLFWSTGGAQRIKWKWRNQS